MEENWAEVDMSNQIDNSWNKDSCLAFRKDNNGYTVKIKSDDKKELRNKFIWTGEDERNKKHNRRVIVIIYCFVLYKLLKLAEQNTSKVRLCNDAGPKWAVHKYLNAIYRYYNEPPIGELIHLRFKKAEGKRSSAHNLARKVMKGRRKADYLIPKTDIKELEDIRRKII